MQATQVLTLKLARLLGGRSMSPETIVLQKERMNTDDGKNEPYNNEDHPPPLLWSFHGSPQRHVTQTALRAADLYISGVKINLAILQEPSGSRRRMAM